MLKKLHNQSEQRTHVRLCQICETYAVSVFSKPRLADVLPIESSGISDTEFRFALQSHLDFLVTDGETDPLFAVEFDGPTHANPKQQERDRVKDSLCERFGLPILRITSDFTSKTYRNMDLLGWIVDVWFLQANFYKAQEAGEVPYDEPFDPLLILTSSDRDGNFPYWLAAPMQVTLQRLYKAGRPYSYICCHLNGHDGEGNLHGFGWLEFQKNEFVTTGISMRRQGFPIDLSALLNELLIFDVYGSVKKALRGEAKGLPLSSLKIKVREFKKQFTVFSSITVGDIG